MVIGRVFGRIGKMFGGGNAASASVAKDRLKIMIQQQRRSRDTPLEHQKLANDVMAVIQKHWAGVDTQDISLHVRHDDDDIEIFEMQVKLPKETPKE